MDWIMNKKKVVAYYLSQIISTILVFVTDIIEVSTLPEPTSSFSSLIISSVWKSGSKIGLFSTVFNTSE